MPHTSLVRVSSARDLRTAFSDFAMAPASRLCWGGRSAERFRWLPISRSATASARWYSWALLSDEREHGALKVSVAVSRRRSVMWLSAMQYQHMDRAAPAGEVFAWPRIGNSFT